MFGVEELDEWRMEIGIFGEDVFGGGGVVDVYFV